MIIPILPLIYNYLDDPLQLDDVCRSIKNKKYKLNLHMWNINSKILRKYMHRAISIFVRSNSNINTADFRYLERIPKLTLYGIKNLCDNDFQYLKQVVHLRISCTYENQQRPKYNIDSSLRYLARLKTLYIDDSIVITDNGMQYLTNILELTTNSQFITDSGLSYLKNIEKLALSNENITDNGLRNLPMNHAINTLAIHHNNKITNEGLKYLKNIVVLELPDNEHITDYGLKYLERIEKLHILSNPGITDNGMRYLKGIVDLKISLYRNLSDRFNNTHYSQKVGGYIMSDYGLQYLSGIQRLCIAEDNITDNGLRYITGIRDLNMDGRNITDIGVLYLSGIKSLRLYGNSKITNVGISCLSGIKELYLWNNINITIDSFKYIDGCNLSVHGLGYGTLNLKNITYYQPPWLKTVNKRENEKRKTITQI